MTSNSSADDHVVIEAIWKLYELSNQNASVKNR